MTVENIHCLDIFCLEELNMFDYCVNNVDKLRNNPLVVSVGLNSIEFSISYKIRLFEKWKLKPIPETIQMELTKEDILETDIMPHICQDLSNTFRLSGYPHHKSWHAYLADEDYVETNPLILSGKFHRREKGRGIDINPAFLVEIQSTYPDISIERKMSSMGIDPVDVGGSLIRKIRKELNRGLTELQEIKADTDSRHAADEKIMSSVVKSIYVKSINRRRLFMSEAFFNEAYLMKAPVQDILEIYGIDYAQIHPDSMASIAAVLKEWIPTDETAFPADKEILRIQNMRTVALHHTVETNFTEIGDRFRILPVHSQRKICEWINSLPDDPLRYFTRRKIRELVGVSKSRYYALLGDKDYGMGIIRRQDEDEKDIVLINEVMDYKGFEKGIRQIYMLTPRVTGKTLSMYRIRKLMNKYGIRTTIRRPSRNRKAMKELIEKNRKANLIMQRFRLHRPNEVRLTDVTYLYYGDDKCAYGSASVDPVTGRLICFIVSEYNDLQLALDTLQAMDQYPAKSGAILHSDQGILYMTDDFQAAVVEMDLRQSMSRRGNCWDNAVQESFFGHFKDECHYEGCKNLEELQKCIDEYGYYYNNERGMWDRGRMTPAEYEEYLENMTEAEFSDYLTAEEQRYEEMKKRSAENAHKAAKDYREFTEKSIGGSDNETGGSFKEI